MQENEKKREAITVWVSKEIKDDLEEKALSFNTKVSTYIRKLILKDIQKPIEM